MNAITQSANVNDYVEMLRRDGYCIVENAFSMDFCDRTLEALHRVAHDYSISPMDQDFSGRNTVRILNLLQYDDLFQEIPVHDSFFPIVEGYLDEECLLSGIDSSEIYPGETGQPIHTDTWWHDDRRFDFPVSVNTIMTLTDFTAENGATRLVPGSHLWSPEEVAYKDGQMAFLQAPDALPVGKSTQWAPIVAEAPKGSMIIFDTRILHGAGGNCSGSPRPSVISPYVLGWLRQFDNFAYGLPAEKLRQFSPRLQKLIGLECFRGAYGHVNNMSPREWLWDRKVHQKS